MFCDFDDVVWRQFYFLYETFFSQTANINRTMSLFMLEYYSIYKYVDTVGCPSMNPPINGLDSAICILYPGRIFI